METHVPFENWSSVIDRTWELLKSVYEILETSHFDRHISRLVHMISSRLERLQDASPGEVGNHIYYLSSDLYQLGDMVRKYDKDLSEKINSVADQMEGRSNLKQSDTFKVLLANRFAAPMKPSTVGHSHVQTINKDVINKHRLINLYKWAVNKLSKYNQSHGLLHALERDIYDVVTWKVLFDFAEEHGINADMEKAVFEDIFKTKPVSKELRFQHGKRNIVGWHENHRIIHK